MKLLKLFYCAVLLMSAAIPLIAQQTQWEKISLPVTNITAITFNGQYLFAGTSNGSIFRSADDGATWARVSNGLDSSISITTLTTNGATVFAGTRKGVFSSENGGDTWIRYGQLPRQIYALWVGYEDKLFATTESGMWYSDGNKQFKQTSVTNKILCLAGRESLAIAGSQDGKIYRTTDAGRSWTQLAFSTTASITSATITPQNILVIGTGDGRIYRSLDMGSSWQLLLRRTFPMNISALFSVNNLLLAGTDDGQILLSVDSGTTWRSHSSFEAIFPQLAPRPVVFPVIYDKPLPQVIGNEGNFGSTVYPINTLFVNIVNNNNHIYFGTNTKRLFFSRDTCRNWNSPGAEAFGIPDIQTVYGSRDTLFVVTDRDIFLSTGNRNIWNSKFLRLFDLTILPKIFISSKFRFSFHDDGVSRYVDICRRPLGRFLRWRADGLPFGDGFWALDSVNNFSSIVGNANFTFWSTDRGIFKFNENTPDSVLYKYGSTNQAIKDRELAFLSFSGSFSLFTGRPTQLYAKDNTVLVASDSGFIYRSPNINATFPFFNSTSFPPRLNVLTFWGSTSSIFAGTAKGVYRSTDDGQSWQQSGLKDTTIQALWGNGSVIFAGTTSGVFLSTNNGSTWKAFNSGLTNLNVRSLWSNLDTVFVGTAGGLFKSAVPHILTASLKEMSFNYARLGTSSDVQGYSLTGSYLTENRIDDGIFYPYYGETVSIRASEGFEISPSRTGPWATELSRPSAEGIINDSIFVRFSPKKTLAVSGFITHISKYTTATIQVRSVNPADPNRRILSTAATTFVVVQPNPLSNEGLVRYSTNKDGLVSLTLTDALGRIVLTLTEGVQTAGEYTVPFSARTIPTGRYYIVLQTSSEQQSYPLEVIK